MKKRLLTILLVLCMVLQFAPSMVLADESNDPPDESETIQTSEEILTSEQEEIMETGEITVTNEQVEEDISLTNESSEDDINLVSETQATHTHCVCGGKTVTNHSSCQNVTYVPWDGKSNISYTNNVAYVYLTADVSRSSILTIKGKTLYLCLNGHSLKNGKTNQNTIDIEENGKLILTDCIGTGTVGGRKSGSDSGAIWLAYNAKFDMYGGSLTGSSGLKNGGGVVLKKNGAVFNMYGGKIVNNSVTKYGGAVYIYGSGTFNMYGGEISGNKSSNWGGAIVMQGNGIAQGSFNMYGGTISSNSSKYGGAIYTTNGGHIEVHGGTITNNTATYNGGAIYTDSLYNTGTIKIYDGTISNNTANDSGGGIYMTFANVLYMYGGTISGNIAKTGAGGGMCLVGSLARTKADISGGSIINNKSLATKQEDYRAGGIFTSLLDLTITGGTISGNSAVGDGGGMYLSNKTNANFSNVVISNNTSKYGAGIYITGSTELILAEGVSITGNVASSQGSAVFVRDSTTITLKDNASITGNTGFGAIYVSCSDSSDATGQIKVSGSPVVKENTNESKPSNVYLSEKAKVEITADMVEGASVGITTYKSPTLDTSVVFSKEYASDQSSYYFADDDRYLVRYNEAKQLELYINPDCIYTVTYDPGVNGVGESSTVTKIKDEPITLKDVCFTRNGFTQIGWTLTEEGEKEYDLSGSYNGNGSVSIYPAWQAKSGYTVIFETGENDSTYLTKADVKWTDKVLDNVEEPIKEGYSFAGWYLGETLVDVNDTYGQLALDDTVMQITLNAKWNTVDYKIEYDLYGGTATNPTTYTIESEDITLVNPTKNGYEFAGWSGTDLTGETNMTVTIKKGSIGDRSYVAHWNAKDYYKVIFESCNYEYLSKTNVKWTDIVLEEVTDPTYSRNGFTVDGYEFTGWTYGTTNVTTTSTYGDLAVNDTVMEILLIANFKDVAAPTGKVTVAENIWTSLLNDITFGVFFKETQAVTITATDNSEGNVKIEYYLSDKQLSEEELAKLENLTLYEGLFNIDPDNEYVIYVRLTDESGNSSWINTDGIVLDATSPVFEGVEDGKNYCKELLITVIDKHLDSVTVNGELVELVDGQFTLMPEGEQTIVATDKLGNTTTITIHFAHTGGKATYTEKAKCEVCGQEYGDVLPKRPSTGDNSNLIFWIVVTIVSASSLLMVINQKKKKLEE